MVSRSSICPIISVCVVTYNQEKYIEKCIESIISQEFDLPYEIVVADDNSTDNTRALLENFKEQHPNRIRLLLNERNLGPTQNSVLCHNSARGRYVSHCDGDDFFYARKLDAQYRFLEANRDYSAVWHGVDVYSEDGSILREHHASCVRPYVSKRGVEDLVAFGSFAANSSIMYRNGAINWATNKYLSYDFEFAFKLLEAGNGAIINIALGGYRRSTIGSLSTSLIKQGVNQQRLDQFVLWQELAQERPYLQKFVGFFAIKSIIKAFLKKEKIPSQLFFGVFAIFRFSYRSSLLRAIIRKFFS